MLENYIFLIIKEKKTKKHARQSGSQQSSSSEEGEEVFPCQLIVNIELLGDAKIPAYEVIQSARLLCGGLLACWSIAARKYELTMSNIKGKERLLEGFKIGETAVVASELANDEMVVSFLNLPAYVEDEEILEKLCSWGVQAVSPIRRRMWPGTRIADGTRFLKVKFNEKVQSLPYSTKFNTALETEYFRVIHDKQVKVCRLCTQRGHILRDCPEFTCHKCGVQGHFVRECSMSTKKCKICFNVEDKCVCNESEEGDSEELFEESEMEEGLEDGENREQGEGGEQQSEVKMPAKATPAPPGAGGGLGSSLDSVPESQLESRSEAREEAESPSETNPLPQHPTEGSRRTLSLAKKPEMANPETKLTENRGAAPPDSQPSPPNSDEDMDSSTLIPAQKRLNLKLASKKAKRMRAQLKGKLKP